MSFSILHKTLEFNFILSTLISFLIIIDILLCYKSEFKAASMKFQILTADICIGNTIVYKVISRDHYKIKGSLMTIKKGIISIYF